MKSLSKLKKLIASLPVHKILIKVIYDIFNYGVAYYEREWEWIRFKFFILLFIFA